MVGAGLRGDLYRAPASGCQSVFFHASNGSRSDLTQLAWHTLALDEGFTVRGERKRGRSWLISGLRFDPGGRLAGALSRGRLLGLKDSAADTILRLRGAGATIPATTDDDGAATGFDVD